MKTFFNVAIALLPTVMFIGCGDPPPIYLQLSGHNQAPLLNPQKGNIIQWRDNTQAHSPFDPQWIGPSPCDTDQKYTSKHQCHVVDAADNQIFAYTCKDTPCDPDVPVGSDVVVFRIPLALAITAPNPVEVHIYCDTQNKVAVDKPNPDVSASNNGGLYWVGLGAATSSWSVTDTNGQPLSVCQENTIGPGANSCTFKAGTLPQTVTYKVTAAACSASPTATPSFAIKP